MERDWETASVYNAICHCLEGLRLNKEEEREREREGG